MFDVDSFISSTVDAPMDTEYPVCPEGEYPFLIDTKPDMLKPKNIKGVSNATGKPYDFFQLELTCLCQSDEVRKAMGREQVPVRMRINLDFDVNGRLDTSKGKNIILGQLRSALNQNTPGWSPQALLGAGPFIGRVRQQEGKDGRKYADIVGVAPMR